MVLYRKYRPQKISELTGQEHIKKMLLGALLAGRLSHAYLFSGPRGVGKTTTARILAKAINCEGKNRLGRDGQEGASFGRRPVRSSTQAFSVEASTSDTPRTASGTGLELTHDTASLTAQDQNTSDGGHEPFAALEGKLRRRDSSEVNSSVVYGEPCDECSSCISIRDGRSLDLIEIDAASNRGIDEIRDLREKIRLLPTQARFKVYIIDEVHMLTNEAFNALLKTLEEPPAHAIFVLCTTELSKLPQTIISRCQRYEFQRASEENLVETLTKVAKSEKLKYEEGAILEIAKKADGSFRDAKNILEQLLSLKGEIKKEHVWALFSAPATQTTGELLDFLVKNSAKEAIEHLNEAVQKGVNVREFSRNFLEYLRGVLLIHAGVGEVLVKANKTRNQYEKMVEQSRTLDQSKLIGLIKLFTRASEDLKFAQIPQLPLELAIVEACEEKS